MSSSSITLYYVLVVKHDWELSLYVYAKSIIISRHADMDIDLQSLRVCVMYILIYQ